MSWFLQLNKFFSPEFGQIVVQVLPELGLLCLSILFLLLDAFLPRLNKLDLNQNSEFKNNIVFLDNLEFKNYKITFWLFSLVLILGYYFLYVQHNILASDYVLYSPIVDNLVDHMIINDNFSYIIKTFMIFLVLICFYYSENYLRKNRMFSGEYYAMAIFSLIGMMVLVSSQHMLVLYLGLELFSLPVYAMVAMQRKSSDAGEAALKYFVMGAIASGILLFGISIIYGISGSMILSDIYKFSTGFSSNFNPAFIMGLLFICVGVAFKFGAAPFHMWVPDVYEGSPTPAAMFIAVAPKLAAFGMAIRFFHEAFAKMSATWGVILLIFAVISIFWGNIAAIAQTNLKRLLAYSGISHMGFVLLGLVAVSSNNAVSISQGYTASLFYVITYAITVLATFGFIIMCSGGDNKVELKTLDDYKGLYYKEPWLALLLMMLLFSMAGVPPFVGFFAKMSIIQSIVSADYIYLAVFAVLMTVIGAFYYLRLVWLMFFEQVPDYTNQEINVNNSNFIDIGNLNKIISLDMKLLVSLNCLLVLFLGLYGQRLFSWCASVF